MHTFWALLLGGVLRSIGSEATAEQVWT